MKKIGSGFFIVFLLLFIPFSLGQGAEPKNVILVIGDGMGPQAVGLAVYYNLFMNGPGKPLNMERLMAAGNTGYCLTYQYGTVIDRFGFGRHGSGVRGQDAGCNHRQRSRRPRHEKRGRHRQTSGEINRSHQHDAHDPRHARRFLRPYHPPGQGKSRSRPSS